jgi:hypothetical protein
LERLYQPVFFVKKKQKKIDIIIYRAYSLKSLQNAGHQGEKIMEINISHGANTYANVLNTTPRVNEADLSGQNSETSTTDLNTKSATTRQKAFEVRITQEAQDKLAAQTTEDLIKAQTATPEDQTNQNVNPAHGTNRIVNIIA